MKMIEAWVEGATPILLHRATEEALTGGKPGGSTGSRPNTVAAPEDPRTIANKAVYRFADKQLALPGAAFMRLLRESGSNHKARGQRKSLKYIVPAAVLVMDELCGLYMHDRKTKVIDFEVDSRPVTIPATKGRVMRYRARLNEWACKVVLRVNDDLLDTALVRQLLSEGVQQIGLGDFRPEKGGPFGTADLVSWEVMTKAPLTSAQKRNGKGQIEAYDTAATTAG